MDLNESLREIYRRGRSVLASDDIAILDRAATALVSTFSVERAIGVGEAAPDFRLPNATGREFALSESLPRGPVVLAFYRGSWCPYCNLALRALQERLPDIASLGAELVAISPEIPDETVAMSEKLNLGFEVLSDVGLEVASSYGISFAIADDLAGLYDRLGHELARRNGGHDRALVIPATYVIDSDGTVAWCHVDPDYTTRAEPADVVAALASLVPRPRSNH